MARAWLVHVYTASGVAFALLATLEACRTPPDARVVFVWLTIAVLIDATDGPLARRFDVKRIVPQIDGRKIDDIVDYLTFTFVPLLLVARMGWVPQPALVFVIPAMVTSLFGFANLRAKDESGGFFLGFPSYWNIVAFYLGLSPWLWLNGAIVLVLAALTLMPVGFIYPNLAPKRWKAAVLIGAFVWLAMLLAMLVRYPDPPLALTLLSLAYPAFYTAVSVVEYGRVRAG